jgi:hypothetical protein
MTSCALLTLILAAQQPIAYLGFDCNQYPGDAHLPALRQHFWYTGYWLNNPPGEKKNTWTGKRQTLEAAGFGFLILFNGRLESQLQHPVALGKADAAKAIDAARREGFPAGAVIFLDQEEGGRMTPPQRAYIHAWVDGVNATGYRAGIYCSGIPAPEGKGVTVTTALDIQENAGDRAIVYWVANDTCPASPGCVAEARPPGASGVQFASVWQFAQSPGRKLIIGRCALTYNRDGNCYSDHLPIDMNTANSPDPSHGRTQ